MLTYFPSRGLAELLRIVLTDAGVAFAQRSVTTPGADGVPLFDTLRADGTLAFNSVPLWEEPDGFRLVQSDAILRHLARTYGLYGANAREAALCDQVHEGTKDVRAQLARLRTAAPEARAALRAELESTILPRWLGHFERLLAAHGTGCFVGADCTYADLSVWSLLEALVDNGLAGPLGPLPLLTAFQARIAARPNLARYLADPARYPAQLLPT